MFSPGQVGISSNSKVFNMMDLPYEFVINVIVECNASFLLVILHLEGLKFICQFLAHLSIGRIDHVEVGGNR